MAGIDDPKHPYYLHADPVVSDVNKVSPELAYLGDNLQPIPTKKNMSANELADIARRSEDLSTEDKIKIAQMQDLIQEKGQHQPVNTVKVWSIPAPWKK